MDARKLRILLATRSYPAADDLYRYPFVHRRVRAYQAAGHEVSVFRPTPTGASGTHWFDGVECTSGQAGSLDALAARFRPEVLAIHGLGPPMWPALERVARSMPVAVWLHGSEIPGFLKRKSSLDGQAPESTSAAVEASCNFWRTFLRDKGKGRRLVFPSRTAVAYAEEGFHLHAADYAIIPNPIDTELFVYRPKQAEQRFEVLLLRPFDSRAYANDVAVAAIQSLQATLPGPERVRFRLLGDGPLFDETIEPLRGLANVSVRRGFLTQQAIAAEHARSGIFLVPTRLDTQGVSRDEAMSSGLVPVTSAIAPINEFVDESCAALAAADDPDALAAAVAGVMSDPQAFLAKSAHAAGRIRSSRSSVRIIPDEIELLRELSDA